VGRRERGIRGGGQDEGYKGGLERQECGERAAGIMERGILQGGEEVRGEGGGRWRTEMGKKEGRGGGGKGGDGGWGGEKGTRGMRGQGKGVGGQRE